MENSSETSSETSIGTPHSEETCVRSPIDVRPDEMQTPSAQILDSIFFDDNQPDPDFVSFVTAASIAYSRRRYLKFTDVDGNPPECELKPLGQGSTFSVYARQIKYDQPSAFEYGKLVSNSEKVVIKRTKSPFFANGLPHRPQDIRSLIMELRILSMDSLYQHPNVIQFRGISWRCEQFYPNPAVQPQLVLEAADETLDDLLCRHGELPFERKLGLAQDVVAGIKALHACGIVHGDVKTANILIHDTVAKVADFSLSWIDTGKPIRHRVGTPGYMAPEMIRGDIIFNAKATDIFSLGVVIWRILMTNDKLPKAPGDLPDHPESEADPCLAVALEMVVEKFEGDANLPRHHLVQRLLTASISANPEQRNLRILQSEINVFLGKDATWEAVPPKDTAKLEKDSSGTEIYINYQAFIHSPGPVQDQLVACLEHVSQTPSDPRNARALYELGVCNISQFGDPNKMKPTRSLEYIFQAAKQGNMMAKGYFKRFLETLSPMELEANDTHTAMKQHTSKWLLEAAAAGHQVAFEDYTEAGSHAERKMEVLDLRALGRFNIQFSTSDLEQFKEEVIVACGENELQTLSTNDRKDSVLHWAAYRDLEDHMRYLIDEIGIDINCKNRYGETPLMTACSVGNKRATLFLLRRGCEVNSVNIWGETCLHDIWRFSDQDATGVLRALSKHGVEFEIIAPPRGESCRERDPTMDLAIESDPLPILHGKAIERVVARGRTSLLNDFLTLSLTKELRNGNETRRMILWATILNFPQTRQLLIRYAEGQRTNSSWRDAIMNSALHSIEESPWEHEGLVKGYMDAAAQGWLSVCEEGWSTPEVFWRMCCHGPLWSARLEDTIRAVATHSEKPLCQFESPLLHALNARHSAFCRLYLTMYIDEHGEFNTQQGTKDKHACTNHIDPQRADSGFETVDDVTQTRLIDQILFQNDHTLLQRSIIFGDRQMFQIMVQFEAMLTRPWSLKAKENEIKAKDKSLQRPGLQRPRLQRPREYLSCYSVLAVHSKDIWFAHEFDRLGVRHNQTSPRYGFGVEVWPPLLHALDQGFFLLAAFLLAQEASLEERLGSLTNVLDRALSPRLISQDTTRFLFGRQGEYTKPDGTVSQISKTLLPPIFFSHGYGHNVLDLLAVKWYQTHPWSDPAHENSFPLTSPLLLPVVPLQQLSRYNAFLYPFSVLSKILYLTSSIHISIVAYFMLPLVMSILPSQRFLQSDMDQNRWILPQIWEDMLERFPNALSGAKCCRGRRKHYSRSLLAILILSPSSSVMGDWVFGSFVWPFMISHISPNISPNNSPKEALPKDTETIILKTIEHCKTMGLVHKPSLVELLFWNEYSIIPESNTAVERSLYHFGFRRSAMDFLEFRLLFLLLIMGACAVSVYAVHTRILNETLWLPLAAGSQILACLVFSFFERPSLQHRIFVGLAGLGYGLITWNAPNGMANLFLLLAQTVALCTACLASIATLFIDGESLLFKSLLFTMPSKVRQYPDYVYSYRQYRHGFQQAFTSIFRKLGAKSPTHFSASAA